MAPPTNMGKKIDNAKLEFSALGWTLLEDKYSNMDTLMSAKCPEGHVVDVTLKQWRKSSSCPVCNHDSVLKSKGRTIKNRVIAIDDATQISGWAVFDDSELVSYGKFAAKAGEASDRIVEIGDWLIGLLDKWQPDTIIIEDIQQQANVSVFKVLAKLQGVLEYLLKKSKRSYYIVHSQTWKSHSKVKGKSRADQKRSAQLIVKEVYGVEATQDECDAILMGRYGVETFIKNNRMVNFES